jgi:hypothetical protein
VDDTSYSIIKRLHSSCILCKRGSANPGSFPGNSLPDDRTWRDPTNIAQRHASVFAKGNRQVSSEHDGGSGLAHSSSPQTWWIRTIESVAFQIPIDPSVSGDVGKCVAKGLMSVRRLIT